MGIKLLFSILLTIQNSCINITESLIVSFNDELSKHKERRNAI